MFNIISYLRAGNKLLGMNARNLSYIRPYNLKAATALADDKVRSKRILKAAGVPVPKLLAKITSREDLSNFDWATLPNTFVLKPNKGLGGAGILIVYARKKGQQNVWIKSNGKIVTVDDLRIHIQHILDGAFSITNSADIAFFEERLQLSKTLKPYAYRGIPDIRVIVYNNVPVMAMLRLPTRASDGKANLQQGGVGVGIDMASGTTTTAVLGKGTVIEYIPNTRHLLSGIKIPYWDDILTLCVKAQQASGLGFLGADVAIDRENGPVFLELNARPGLSIQVANMAGLKSRLHRVDGLKIKSVRHGVTVGKNIFGGEIEQDLEETSGKKVIGATTPVVVTGKNNQKVETIAKIDTGAYSTSIDTELAKDLGFGHIVDEFNKIDLSQYNLNRGQCSEIEKKIYNKYKKSLSDLVSVIVIFSSSGISIRPVIKIKFTMDKKTIPAKVNIIDRSDLKYDMIIGKRNLYNFLVDVSK